MPDLEVVQTLAVGVEEFPVDGRAVDRLDQLPPGAPVQAIASFML
jgi:hypothetical protein